MNQSSNWSPEQIELLRQYAGTISCFKIGELIGRSKDAVNNKIRSMNLPRLPKNETVAKPKKPVAKKKPPMISRYKNPDKKENRALLPTSRLEWCKTCNSPVSNKLEHFERLGCKLI